jgi:hypothetical protein
METPFTMTPGFARLTATGDAQEPGPPEPSPTVRVTWEQAPGGKMRAPQNTATSIRPKIL